VSPYTHYNDPEDILSIHTDVAFLLQQLLLVPLMVTPKSLSFPLFRNLKFCHHLRNNIPMIILVKAMRDPFYLKGLGLSKMK
jgi:hypothetical protein